MGIYNASGSISIGVNLRIEAGSLEEAQEIAERISTGEYVEGQPEWSGMTNYAGNGGTDRLVGLYGHSGDGWSIEAESDFAPTFDPSNVFYEGESEQDYD